MSVTRTLIVVCRRSVLTLNAASVGSAAVCDRAADRPGIVLAGSPQHFAPPDPDCL
jgi:hypothetical protein